MAIKEQGLHKFYRRRSQDLLVFGWVKALTSKFPTISIDNALDDFAKYFKVDDFNKERAKLEYNRMQKELLDCLKKK